MCNLILSDAPRKSQIFPSGTPSYRTLGRQGVATKRSDTAYEQPEVYAEITNPPPSRIYLAGDTWSYLPGWQEGAITAAYEAIDRMSRAN